MAYNNDSNEYPQNPSIWGSTQELSDTPNTLIYGRGTPYVGIFDENGKPIIEPQSQNSLGELCTDFTYTSVEQGMDTADITIQCSNPNLLALPSLHYRSILILQWGYLPSYSGDSLYSHIKKMVILKRETVFNDNGVTVNLHLSDPNYFLYLMNPNYLGIPGVGVNDLSLAIAGLNGLGVPVRITDFNYRGNGETQSYRAFLIPDGFKLDGEVQSIDDINPEVIDRHKLDRRDPRRLLASRPLQDEQGNPLTTSYEYVAIFNEDELSNALRIVDNSNLYPGYENEDNVIEARTLVEQYNFFKSQADKMGWVERTVVDPLVDVSVSYIGGTKNDANILNQVVKGFNHVTRKNVMVRGNGSGELLLQTEPRTNIPYRTYTWAGGNGELLEFSASDDFSVNNIYGNESKDIDPNKNYNSIKAIDADSDPKILTVYNTDPTSTYNIRPITTGGPVMPSPFVASSDGPREIDAYNNRSWTVSDFGLSMYSSTYNNTTSPWDTYYKAITNFMNESVQRNIRVYSESYLPSNGSNIINTILTEYPLTDSEIQMALNQLINYRKNLEKVNDVEKNLDNYTGWKQITIPRKIRLIVEGDENSKSRQFFNGLTKLKDYAIGQDTDGSKYFARSSDNSFSFRVDDITYISGIKDPSEKNFEVKFYEVTIQYSIPNQKSLDSLIANGVNVLPLTNNLYQVTSHKIEAKARLLGNPELEATLNVNIQGVGEYSMRWFVTKVVHQINQESGYICDVEFRPYDQNSKQLILSASEAADNLFKTIKTIRERVKELDPDTSQDYFTRADSWEIKSRNKNLDTGDDSYSTNIVPNVSMTEGYEFLDSMNDNITNQSPTNAQNLQQDN